MYSGRVLSTKGWALCQQNDECYGNNMLSRAVPTEGKTSAVSIATVGHAPTI